MDPARVDIRPCGDADLGEMVTVINSAAVAYAGVIPADRYHQPYMPLEELCAEIAGGVRFWGLWSRREEAGAASVAAPAPAPELAGVMGIQDVGEVTLIRHAYVRPGLQRAGVGGRLLAHLNDLAAGAQPPRPLLVGTWAAAWWAVAFYERHGFVLVTPEEKDRLLRRYWSIPERQVETSVVLRFAGSDGPA
jgi:GNAT superfamily N-acetyltransferase